MKKILVIVLFFLNLISYSQGYKDYIRERNTKFAFSFTQDFKLATRIDDAGNKPFTLDIFLKTEWRTYSRKHGYFSIMPYFEFANLFGGNFRNYGINLGFTFDEYIVTPEIYFIPSFDIELMPYIGFGYIERQWIHHINSGWESFKTSYNIGLDVTIKLTNKIGILLDVRFMSRVDLKSEYPSFNEILSYNFGVGFKYEVGTKLRM